MNQKSRDPFHRPTPIYTSILRTCRTIYLEAIEILYGDNTFRWKSIDGDLDPCLRILLGGVETASLYKNLQLIIGTEYLTRQKLPLDNLLSVLAQVSESRNVLEVVLRATYDLQEIISDDGLPIQITNPVQYLRV